jgi:chromosome partitioning protein
MNEKGGSGKTTTTISLAAVLAERGYRILVVDLDPQASASLWLGRGREPGLYRAIAEKRDLEPFVRATAVAGLDIIAGSRDLAAVDDLRGRIGIQTALKRALARLQVRWDVVLIDCPPNLGLLSVNALAAADEVLVPVETHGIAAIGLSDLLRTVEDPRITGEPRAQHRRGRCYSIQALERGVHRVRILLIRRRLLQLGRRTRAERAPRPGPADHRRAGP